MLEEISLVLAVVFLAVAIFLLVTYLKLKNRYKDVIDVDKEVRDRKKQVSETEKEIEDLRSSYKAKKEVFENLSKEVQILEDNLEMKSFGIYEPQYSFDSSEKYKKKLDELQDKRKQMIRDKTSYICPTNWQVGGSKAEGTKMINRSSKLMLRAFNGECDAAIAKVKWNNFDRMEARIRKSFEAVNKAGEPMNIWLTDEYLQVRIDELHVSHEYQEKLQDEKEEQRRIREEMREEEKARREFEKAKKDAEQEEARYKKALEKARADVEKASGEELDKLKAEMEALEQQLKEAEEKGQRALSMAEQTKRGHVYVISNIGSFGENVYKIGMTRRLEPLDRVKELGDASVPFNFDVHAMIFSEDAPSLENALHKKFEDKRVNLVNLRREYFDVSLADIETEVRKENAEIEFTKLAEAKEYRETQALRESLNKSKEPVEEVYPAEL
ncbi:DUF4041 domain-containing protein [bacterium]|nr:DUF4041 domain-containing protein [bacterium]